MKQPQMRGTFIPLHRKDLTEEHNNIILEFHLFFKEKRNGTLKGSKLSGWNKQREFVSKEYARSPRVATESVLLTCIVDVEEHIYVATVDIPNIFIHTRIEDEKDTAIIKIRGVSIYILL